MIQVAKKIDATTILGLSHFPYTTQSAIADLIDNSIKAESKNISLWIKWQDIHTRACIFMLLDDGHGMNEIKLENAMTLGRKNLANRANSDLGRFGFGLKTASFNQCGQLSVVSKKNGEINSRQWDKSSIENDCITLTDNRPDGFMIEKAIEYLKKSSSGTLVIWNKLEKIVDQNISEERARRRMFFSNIEKIEKHLSTVFAYYIEGGLNVYINPTPDSRKPPLKPFDIFQEKHLATERVEPKYIPLKNHQIKVQGYVLPQKNDYPSYSEWEDAGGENGWSEQQGIYLFRKKRLMRSDGWCGLSNGQWGKSRKYNRVRIKLDYPTELDQEFETDVSKTRAKIPKSIISSLELYCERVRSRCLSTAENRDFTPHNTEEDIWLRVVKSDNTVDIKIKKNHPSILEIKNCLDKDTEKKFDKLINLIEKQVPRIFTIEYESYSDQASGDNPSEAIEKHFRKLKQEGFSNDEASKLLKRRFTDLHDIIDDVLTKKLQ